MDHTASFISCSFCQNLSFSSFLSLPESKQKQLLKYSTIFFLKSLSLLQTYLAQATFYQAHMVSLACGKSLSYLQFLLSKPRNTQPVALLILQMPFARGQIVYEQLIPQILLVFFFIGISVFIFLKRQAFLIFQKPVLSEQLNLRFPYHPDAF